MNPTTRTHCAAMVAFSIEILGAWYQPFYYTGLVEVNWDTPVGQEAQTWGGIKSLFHPGR